MIGAVATPVAWRHTTSECHNCGQPIYTNAKILARANDQDVWRHRDTNQQECNTPEETA